MNKKNWEEIKIIFDVDKPYMQIMQGSLMIQRNQIKEELNPLIIRMILDLENRLEKIEEMVKNEM